MTELTPIEAAILDRDGSCRDINFQHPTWDGIEAFVQNIEKRYDRVFELDGDGKTIAVLVSGHLRSRVLETGTVRIT